MSRHKATPAAIIGREPRRSSGKRGRSRHVLQHGKPISGATSPSGIGLLAVTIVFALALIGQQIYARYTISFQSPVLIRLQWPVVIAYRSSTEIAKEAQFDQQGHALTAYQQYACEKFGSDCRIALAIQRAENPKGKCEIYHYNTDGTLDWGYFQINTVHLKRPGLNLRDLLDCRANIDFAYQLYLERGGFTPWSTFNSGAYLRHFRQK